MFPELWVLQKTCYISWVVGITKQQSDLQPHAIW